MFSVDSGAMWVGFAILQVGELFHSIRPNYWELNTVISQSAAPFSTDISQSNKKAKCFNKVFLFFFFYKGIIKSTIVTGLSCPQMTSLEQFQCSLFSESLVWIIFTYVYIHIMAGRWWHTNFLFCQTIRDVLIMWTSKTEREKNQ